MRKLEDHSEWSAEILEFKEIEKGKMKGDEIIKELIQENFLENSVKDICL